MTSLCLPRFDFYSVTLLVLHCTSILGDVYIHSVPSNPAKGDSVLLNCVKVFDSQNSTRVSYPDCSVKWTHSPLSGPAVAITQNTKHISIIAWSRKNGSVAEAGLEIVALEKPLEGQYTCLWNYPDSSDSASLNLQLQVLVVDGNTDGATTLIATTLSIVVIILVLVCLMVWSVREHVRRKALAVHNALQPSTGQTDDATDPRTHMEPPPKYCDIVKATYHRKVEITGTGCQGTNQSQDSDEEADECEITLLALPNYDAALKMLESNGVPFDPESIQPMPPSYSKIQNDCKESDI